MSRKRWRISKMPACCIGDKRWEVTQIERGEYRKWAARFATFDEAIRYVDMLAYLAGYSSERVG